MNEIKELWASFQKQKIFPYACALGRTGLWYLLFFLMVRGILTLLSGSFWAATSRNYASPSEYFGTAASAVLLACELILAVLLLNTVILSFALFAKNEREVFLAQYGQAPENYDKRAERRRLLRSPAFLAECAALFLLFLLLPFWNGFSRLFVLLLGDVSRFSFLIRLLQASVFGAAAFFLNLHAHLDAREYWLELPSKLMQSNLWESMEKKKLKTYHPLRLLWRLVKNFLIYAASAIVFPTVLVAFASILGILRLLLFSMGAILLIGFLFSFNYITALIRRKKFLKGLKKVCAEKGFVIDAIRHPYRSVFRETAECNLSITANGRRYHARLITCIRKSSQLIFSADGSFSRAAPIRIPMARMVMRGGFVQGVDRGNGDDRELLRFETQADYTFEADGEKLLLLNPPPKFVKITHDGITIDADNGDRVGEYTIYAANAFLRALERDAVADPRKRIRRD